MAELHEYGFDFTLQAALHVKAASPEDAEALIRKTIDALDCSGGEWPNGDPLMLEVSVNDNPLTPFEVDGVEPAPVNHAVVAQRKEAVSARKSVVDTKLQLVISEEHKTKLDSLADDTGVSVNELIEKMIDEAAKQSPAQQSKPSRLSM